MQHTKKIMISLVLSSFSLTACGTTSETLIDLNSSVDSAFVDDASSAEITAENNYDDPFADIEHGTVYGIGLFSEMDEDGNPLPQDPDALPFQNNVLDLTLYRRIQTEETPENGMCHAIMMMAVNGNLYDFSVDGKSSTNGILEIDIPASQDIYSSFQATDLPAQKGDNHFLLCMIVPEEKSMSHGLAQYSGTFHSDTAGEGKPPVSPTPESSIQNIQTDTTDGKTKAQIENPNGGMLRMYDESDFLSYDEEDCRYKVKQATQFYFELPNTNQTMAPSNRSGVCLATYDGKPLSLWNGSPLAEISMQDTELMKRIPLTNELKPGEKCQIGCIYFDLTNDAGELLTNSFVSRIQIAE